MIWYHWSFFDIAVICMNASRDIDTNPWLTINFSRLLHKTKDMLEITTVLEPWFHRFSKFYNNTGGNRAKLPSWRWRRRGRSLREVFACSRLFATTNLSQICYRVTRWHGSPCTKTTDSHPFSFLYNNLRKIRRKGGDDGSLIAGHRMTTVVCATTTVASGSAG